MCPICVLYPEKENNNLKHTNLFKLFIKSLFNVKDELPLFFSMANVEKMNDKGLCDF